MRLEYSAHLESIAQTSHMYTAPVKWGSLLNTLNAHTKCLQPTLIARTIN